MTLCGAPIHDALVRSWREDGRSVPGRSGGPSARHPAGAEAPRRNARGVRRPVYEIRPYGVALASFSDG
ncbi:hypothetical protein EAO77_21635 [Streptomyces sp. t39]|nr:hypothetical protein EAO77_21635 [Streptomyces sp. t39]